MRGRRVHAGPCMWAARLFIQAKGCVRPGEEDGEPGGSGTLNDRRRSSLPGLTERPCAWPRRLLSLEARSLAQRLAHTLLPPPRTASFAGASPAARAFLNRVRKFDSCRGHNRQARFGRNRWRRPPRFGSGSFRGLSRLRCRGERSRSRSAGRFRAPERVASSLGKGSGFVCAGSCGEAGGRASGSGSRRAPTGPSPLRRPGRAVDRVRLRREAVHPWRGWGSSGSAARDGRSWGGVEVGAVDA